MMITFQNNETGLLYDLSTVTSKMTFKTQRRGSPSSLELELVYGMDYPHGSPVRVEIGSKKLFFGYLFKVKKGKQGSRTLVFYDQIKYLLRNQSYYFKAKNMEHILSSVAKDFELKTGKITAPGDPLPSLLMEDKTALDIIQNAMDQVFDKTGHLLVFWDEYGSLRLDTPNNLRIMTILADASIISDFEYEGSIEDSANIIKVVQDNKSTGKRESYEFVDKNSVKKWGKLQHYVVMDEKANEAQINAWGEILLKTKNIVHETVSLEFSIGDYDFRAGYSVFVDVKEVGATGWYVLDEVVHEVTPTKHTMKVKLFIAGGVS